MKLKKKPIYPVRDIIHMAQSLSDDTPITNLHENFLTHIMGNTICGYTRKELDNTLTSDDIKVSLNFGYYDEIECELYAYVAESDKRYNERIAKYDADLSEYNEWYNIYRHEIELELASRREKKNEKARIKHAMEKADTLAKIAKLEERLSKFKEGYHD